MLLHHVLGSQWGAKHRLDMYMLDQVTHDKSPVLRGHLRF